MDAAPSIVDQVLASPGRPLEPALRQDMEQRFGHDFSRVRVHTGEGAEQSAQDVNAHAYTLGHNIVFGAGRYAPRSQEGWRLIVHELTHVVQQSGVALTIQRQTAESAEIEMPVEWAFAADKRKRTWRRYARSLGKQDAARIRKSGKLTFKDREELNAKLRFFEGGAKDAYIRQVKLILVQTNRPEIEIKAAYVGKLPAVEPREQERIRKRREHTYRFFTKVKDYQLEEAYTSRLHRYLDEGLEANPYWDVEMIEQIIGERAPKAPWHDAARQDFLAKRAVKLREQVRERSLPTLSPYWQNQFGALAEQTAAWPEGARVFARGLLWKWREQVAPYDNNPYLRDVVYPAVAEDTIFKDIVSQFEVVLRDRDRAIQEECRRNSPSRLMKVWGNPCKPWFGESGSRGEDELRNLGRRMRIFQDKDRVPYKDVVYWLQEYMKEVNALPTRMGEAHLQILQQWSVVQGSLALTAGPMKKAPTTGAAAESLKVGDIVSPPARLGLGPQRVIAVLPEGELLEPVTRMPPANRALPTGTPAPGSAIIKPPTPVPPAPRVSTQLQAPKVPAPLVPKLVLHGEMPPVQKWLPPASEPAEQVGVSEMELKPAQATAKREPFKGTEPRKEPAAKTGPTAVAKKSARDLAREVTETKIKEIEKRKKGVQVKIYSLNKSIRELEKKIDRLNVEFQKAPAEDKVRISREIEEAKFTLNTNKGGGLRAELNGTYREEWDLGKLEKNLNEALKLQRPRIRKQTERAIVKQAMAEGLRLDDGSSLNLADGSFKDPNARRPITDKAVIGHKYGLEERRLALEAQKRGMNQTQYEDWCNRHPEWFQIESKAINESHKYEKPGIDNGLDWLPF